MDQFCKVHAVFGNNSIEYLLQKEHPSATIANKTSNQANANRSSITGSNNSTTISCPMGIPGIP
jgi:hypothetical protein